MIIIHYIEYLLLKLWLSFTKLLGLERTAKLAVKIVTFVGLKLKANEVAKKNLSFIFPELTAQEVDKIVVDVWKNFALLIAEIPFFMNMEQEQFNKRINIIGAERLEKIQGKKALFCVAHIANWEIIGKVLANYDLDLCGIYRSANNKFFDRIIQDMRHKTKGTMVPKGVVGAKMLLDALDENKQIVILADQKMKNGIKVPFLGKDAMTAPAIAKLALKYNCPIIPIQIIRKENSHFDIIVHPEIICAGRTPKSIMIQINNEIGEWVKSNISQWFWLHRRWNNR